MLDGKFLSYGLEMAAHAALVDLRVSQLARVVETLPFEERTDRARHASAGPYPFFRITRPSRTTPTAMPPHGEHKNGATMASTAGSLDARPVCTTRKKAATSLLGMSRHFERARCIGD